MDEVQREIAIIDAIQSIEDTQQLQILQEALNRLFKAPHPEQATETLFRVVERFPTSDGYGIFWTIVHGIETLPGYEEHLLRSIDRRPTHFTILMVNRLLNAGAVEVHGRNLISVLEQVTSDNRLGEDV